MTTIIDHQYELAFMDGMLYAQIAGQLATREPTITTYVPDCLVNRVTVLAESHGYQTATHPVTAGIRLTFTRKP